MQKASNDLKNFIFTITVNKRSVYKEQYNFISQTNDRQQRLIENLKEMMSMQLLVLGLFLTSLPLIKCKNNAIKHHACYTTTFIHYIIPLFYAVKTTTTTDSLEVWANRWLDHTSDWTFSFAIFWSNFTALSTGRWTDGLHISWSCFLSDLRGGGFLLHIWRQVTITGAPGSCFILPSFGAPCWVLGVPDANRAGARTFGHRSWAWPWGSTQLEVYR